MTTQTEPNPNVLTSDRVQQGLPTPLGEPILSIRNMSKRFPVGGGFLGFGTSKYLAAVDDVSFDISPSETFGLVGESGCGKTTTANVVLGLEKPSAGKIFFEGEDLAKVDSQSRRKYRRSVQAVFQDPWASLNPRMRINSIIGEPLEISTKKTSKQIISRVGDLMTEVGLNPYQGNLYPHEFSGGQRQRIGIARALALSPKLIVLDEPVSALDVSIRAQILNLLVDLQNEHKVAYLMIAHNLATVRYMCHTTAIMYLGKIREIGRTEDIFTEPLHPYSQALISAALPSHPDIQREEIILVGEVPSPVDPPSGCSFNPRCFKKIGDICEQKRPNLEEKKQKNHFVSCHLYN